MKRNNESLRIYIAVDSSKVSRCKWCGITESSSWLGSNAGIYCSTECSRADYAIRTTLGFFLILIMLIPVLVSMGGVMYLSFLIIGLPIVLILLSPLLYFGLTGLDFRKSIPQDSRRNDVPINTALLKAMSSYVMCPKCNANIDVTKVRNDMIYTCDYCSASGTIEVVKSG